MRVNALISFTSDIFIQIFNVVVVVLLRDRGWKGKGRRNAVSRGKLSFSPLWIKYIIVPLARAKRCLNHIRKQVYNVHKGVQEWK